MQVGFTVLRRADQVEFRSHMPTQRRDNPLIQFASGTGGALVLMGRLYYRNDLAPGAAPGSSDAALALAHYERWGVAGLARLEGDFALVLSDARTQCLLAVRDPLGGYPLFWVRRHDGVRFSTSLHRLLDLSSKPSLDPEYLAEYLVLSGWSLRELECGRCAYQGVQRVLAGTVVSVPQADGPVTTERRWDWLAGLQAPGPARPKDLAVHFAQLLRAAVGQRLRGPTAAQLSGGMDSTSVALLARAALRDRAKGERLHALCLVYNRLAGLSRETSYLEAVLAQAEDLIAHCIPGDNLLDFDSFRSPPPQDEPWPALWRMPMHDALLDTAAQAGMDTVLTGQGADGLLELAPWQLGRLLRRGRVVAAWREAARWARSRACSIWKYLDPYGLVGLLPVRLRCGLGPALRGGHADLLHQGPWTIAPWIRPDFARRLDLRGRVLANLRRMYDGCRPAMLAAVVEGVCERRTDWVRWLLAAPWGLHLAHPFLDPRVVRFCLAVQASLEPEPDWPRKPLLAEAMRGVLPEPTRSRTFKGHFNAVCLRGLARNLQLLEAIVRRPPEEAHEWLDADVLMRCLQAAAAGVVGTMPGVGRLNLTLSLLRWLQSRAANPRPDLSVRVLHRVLRPAGTVRIHG
jgi:asparagine synthase (glutamine-hydrolysing)